ncbi:MAG: hypothetical protein ABUL77_00500 [Bacteroidota bacterium]
MVPLSASRSLSLLCCLSFACGTSMGGPGREAGSPTGVDAPPGQPDASVPADAGMTSAVWRPFSASSPWNTRIAPGAAADSASAALIADFSTIAGQTRFWINIQDYSVPVYWVDSTVTPMVTVMAALGATGFRTGAANDAAVPGTGLTPIPANATPAAGTDRHLAIVDRRTNTEWGFWNAQSTGGTWRAGLAATQDLAGEGVRPPERNNPWWAGHGPRACGFGVVAGLITVDEVRAGRIDHALVIAYPHIRSRYYTPPASTAQGTTANALPGRGILCGGRIQLDPALDLATLGLSPTGLIIARALQEYGAFVGDYSGAVSLYADASAEARAYWTTVALTNDTAASIPLARFRVLQLGTTHDNGN